MPRPRPGVLCPQTLGNNTDMKRRFRRLLTASLALSICTGAFAQAAPPPPVAPVGPELFAVQVKGKAGFINAEGKIAIAPTYQKVYPFREGLAAVNVGGRWGFIDTKGRMVIEPRFAMVGFFSDGLAAFRNKFTSPWGYIDKKGQVVIEPRFDTAEEFRKDVARVGLETLGSKIKTKIADVGLTVNHRYIDRMGNFVPEPAPTHYVTGVPGELIPFTKNGLVGYMDPNGKVHIEPQFEDGHPFSDGVACARSRGRYGFIDKTGKYVIPPRFEYPNNFSEGLAGVPLTKKGWGFIDRTGKVIIPAKFAWVYNGFRHGLVEVAAGGKAGYINKKGEWVWPPSE